jgi:hypothetical protein
MLPPIHQGHMGEPLDVEATIPILQAGCFTSEIW